MCRPPRAYISKAKNAQEAHEAIRPTDLVRRPKDVARYLHKDQFGLYELIWKRTVASQMESAELDHTTVDILAEAAAARSSSAPPLGRAFPGLPQALYEEGRNAEEDENSARLPPMNAADGLKKDRSETTQHFTEPPPRYLKASLVKSWKSSASAGPRPTPRSSRCCAPQICAAR